MSIAGVTSSTAATAALQSNALGGTTTPVVDEANLPSEIRNGTADQKKAYQAALSFESVLVNQMTKTMMATTGMPGTGSAMSSDSGSDSSFSNDASSQMLASTLPDTLATAIMNNGGLGLAKQLDTSYPTATSLTPSKNGAVSTDTTTTPSSTTTADASTGAGQGGTAA